MFPSYKDAKSYKIQKRHELAIHAETCDIPTFIMKEGSLGMTDLTFHFFNISHCIMKYTTMCKIMLVAMTTKYTFVPYFTIERKNRICNLYLFMLCLPLSFDVLHVTVSSTSSWHICTTRTKFSLRSRHVMYLSHTVYKHLVLRRMP